MAFEPEINRMLRPADKEDIETPTHGGFYDPGPDRFLTPQGDEYVPDEYTLNLTEGVIRRGEVERLRDRKRIIQLLLFLIWYYKRGRAGQSSPGSVDASGVVETMTQKFVGLNASKTESGNNTYTDEKFEIPGSEGAKQVILLGGEVDVDAPSEVNSTKTTSHGEVSLGDKTDRSATAGLSGDDVVSVVQEVKLCDASGVILIWNSDAPKQIVRKRNVPETNGRYYVTMAVKGTSNTSTMTIRASLDFLVVR